MNQTFNQHKNPEWWTDENDSAWERVKMAMKRDWDQTKHDLGGNETDTNQKIGNTARQAAGKEAIPPRGEKAQDDLEPAYRFGYGARSEYGDEHPEWDEELEARLKNDWESLDSTRNWETDREAIRYGWDYDDE